MSNFIIHKYTDGTTVSVEWFEPMDGKWKYNTNNHTVNHDFDFPYLKN